MSDNEEQQRRHNLHDTLYRESVLADYEEAGKRLFPVLPTERWYWHAHKHYPVYLVNQDGQWWSIEIIGHDGEVEKNFLTPGLYEQLLPIEEMRWVGSIE